ncbi:hypothetical protein ACKLNO_03435 [Neisseriaceae bacterium B1]
MIGLLVYLFIAKMQDSYADRSATWQWAVGVAIANSIFALFSTPLIYTLIGAVIIFLYAWGHFTLLRRFSDNLLLWLVIMFIGALLPAILPFLFTQ